MTLCTDRLSVTAVDPATLGDADLIAALAQRVTRERHATADVIRILIEFDHRRLYLQAGMPSLFAYCTQVLHYSEHAAFNRIEVARAAAKFPQLLAHLEDGSLHLAGARLLAPHLTDENLDMALVATRHKTKREVEEVVAALAQRSILVAVAAEQYRLHLTISRAARDTLRQVQALLSHQLPDGNVAVIFARAVQLLLDDLQRQRTGALATPPTAAPHASEGLTPALPPTASPPPAPVLSSLDAMPPTAAPVPPSSQVPPAAAVLCPATETPEGPRRSRRVPRAVLREVRRRDEDRCAFVGTEGRCPSTYRLQVHHVVPYAAGGPNTVSNLELRCQAHNIYEAEQHFGAEVIAAARASRASRAASTPNLGATGDGRSAQPESPKPAPLDTAPTTKHSPRGDLPAKRGRKPTARAAGGARRRSSKKSHATGADGGRSKGRRKPAPNRDAPRSRKRR